MTKKIIQNHHVIYENKEHKQEELVVPIRRSVHYYLTKLKRHKELTTFEIKAIEAILMEYKIKNMLKKDIS